jgi:hypothetical protein
MTGSISMEVKRRLATGVGPFQAAVTEDGHETTYGTPWVSQTQLPSFPPLLLFGVLLYNSDSLSFFFSLEFPWTQIKNM